VDFFDKGFWQNIVAEAVFAVATIIILWAKRAAVRWYPVTGRIWNRAFLALLFAVLVASNGWYLRADPLHYWWFFVVSTAISFALMWRELAQFWTIGIVGGDQHVGTGLSYDRALRLCRNSVAFLGVGAAKLSESKEFATAMQRCHRPTSATIRFLLVNPNHDILRHAAEQKGVRPHEYQQKVEDSLKKLARFNQENHYNIEVRFYPEMIKPLFRLMFINEQLCLVSYDVFGEGDGSQLPQMHVKRFEDKRDTDSFYYPFREYFDRLWLASERWDFQWPIR
jgi:hypothetical protein